MHTAHIVSRGIYGIFDVFGLMVEFLGSPEEPGAVFCLMRGTVPPGVPVPFHSHPDAESFFTLSGTVQVLSQKEDRFDWFDVKSDDFVQIPGGPKHAFRNTSSEPVVPTDHDRSDPGEIFRRSADRSLLGQRRRPRTSSVSRGLPPSTSTGWEAPKKNVAVGISLFRDPTRNAGEASQPVNPC